MILAEVPGVARVIKIHVTPRGTHMFPQKLKIIWFSVLPAIADIYIYVFNEQKASF